MEPTVELLLPTTYCCGVSLPRAWNTLLEKSVYSNMRLFCVISLCGSVGNLETFCCLTWDVSSNLGAVTRSEIFSHIMPNEVENDYVVDTQKIDFTVEEGKGRLNPCRDKKLRQALQNK